MIVSSKQIYSYTEECNLMIQNKDGVDYSSLEIQ